MTSTLAATRVGRGARYLDETHPGWADRIDPSKVLDRISPLFPNRRSINFYQMNGVERDPASGISFDDLEKLWAVEAKNRRNGAA